MHVPLPCASLTTRNRRCLRWARAEVEVKTVEVRIETIRAVSPAVSVDVETTPHHEHEPLLVVFSNDKKKTKSEKRELHEIIMQLQVDAHEDVDDYYHDDDDDFHDDSDYDDWMYNRISKRDTSAAQRSSRRRFDNKQDYLLYKNATLQRKRDAIERLQQQITTLETQSDDDVIIKPPTPRRRRKRSLQQRRHRRNLCRKRKLSVNLREIKWHKWIIAPENYEVSAHACRTD